MAVEIGHKEAIKGSFSDNETRYSRRNVMKAAIGIGAGAVIATGGGLAVFKSTRGEELSPPRPFEFAAMTADQRVEAIKRLKIANLQEKYPEGSPTIFIGQSLEQIRDGGPIPINDETATDAGIANYFVKNRMTEAANYGWSQENLIEAARNGYAVGEGDPQTYREYLTNFMRSRFSGLFGYDYRTANGESHSDILGDFLMDFSQNFEYVIGNGGLANNKGPQFTVGEVNSIPTNDFERRLYIEYSLKSPIITKTPLPEGPNDYYTNATYEGYFVLDINSGADGNYIVGLNDYMSRHEDQPL